MNPKTPSLPRTRKKILMMSKMRSGPHCTSDSRRHQLGGPVASKLDCHRDKNLLLGDFYHSQLWWTLACCHRRTGGKIEDEGEECGNDDTLVADKGQLWKPRKNVKKSRRSLLIWVRSLSNLVRNSLNNCLRLNLNDVPLVLRLMKVDKIVNDDVGRWCCRCLMIVFFLYK